jgi:hypothetical protein
VGATIVSAQSRIPDPGDILALVLSGGKKVSPRTSPSSAEVGATYKLPHAALLDSRLIPAIDLGDVVTLDLSDLLVHGEVACFPTS